MADDDIWEKVPAQKKPQGKSPAADLWEKVSSAPAAEKPSAGASLWQRLTGADSIAARGESSGQKAYGASVRQGLGEVASGVQEMAGLPGTPLDIGELRQRTEQAYSQNPDVRANPLQAGGGRVAGNMAATLPLGGAMAGAGPILGGMSKAAGTIAPSMVAGMGAGGRALLGGIQGAAGGAMQSGGNPGSATIGGGIGAATGGLGSMVGPMIDPAMLALSQKFPSLGRLALGAEGRTPEAFQRGTANYVMEDIGKTVPPNIKAGDQLINHTHDEVSDTYNALLPKTTFRAREPGPYGEPTFASGLPNLSKDVPPVHEKEWNQILDGEVHAKLDANGHMSGNDYKRSLNAIHKEERYYSKPNQPGADDKYRDALRDLQSEMRESLALHNPAQSDALRKADASWHKLVLMEEAAGRLAKANSTFEPADLLQVGRREIGNKRFARNQGVFTAFARAGNSMLEGKPPQAQKLLIDAVGGMAGRAVGAAVGGPVGAEVGGLAGAGATALGQKAVGSVQRARMTPAARKTGEIISRIAAPAGTAGSSAIDRATDRLNKAKKVGEIQKQRSEANRRGDFVEFASLGKKLAAAHRDYRDAGGQA
jgi:hypothetical protein